MTDDLVKRLREDWTPIYGGCVGTMFEAADRIEQLEEALQGVIAVADRNCPEFRAARAALEGKDAPT